VDEFVNNIKQIKAQNKIMMYHSRDVSKRELGKTAAHKMQECCRYAHTITQDAQLDGTKPAAAAADIWR
jgi:hypothetical protein